VNAGGLRAAAVSALAIDRGAFQPVAALRGAAGVAIPVAIATAVGHPADGAIAAAGALPAGVAAYGGGFRSRAGVILATALGMTVSTFVGSLVAGHLGPMLAVLAVWGFAAGLAVAVSREATIVGTQAVMGLVVFGRFPGSVAIAAVHAAWVLAGAGLQGVLAAVVRTPVRFRSERWTLARVYAELAQLARDPTRSALSAATEAATATMLIARRPPSEDVDILRGLSDEANRIRLEIQSLATVLDVPMVEAATSAAAGWLDRVAVAIRHSERAPGEDQELARCAEQLAAQRDAAAAGRAGTAARYASARVNALLGQLRAVDRLTNALAGIRRLVLPRAVGAPVVVMLPRQAADSVRQMRAVAHEPRSAAFRHAVRLAVVLPLSEALGHALPWQRGYWITLTAAVVLKPDYAATAQRGLARVGGTGLGVVAAGLLVVAVHPPGAGLVALLALATWAAYASFAASYALYSIAVTAIVVLLLAPLGGNELSTVGDRALDTLVGGALALLAYAVWPTWERDTLAASVARLLRALATYTDLVLSAYVDPERLDPDRIAEAAGDARRARIAALASYDRAAAEPARAGGDLDRASGALSAARRIVIELHALRTTVSDATEHVAVPEVAEIRDALCSALTALADGETVSATALRGLQHDLAAERDDDLTSLRARRRALVAAHLDPLVDSVNTLAHVLGAEPTLSEVGHSEEQP
jgi:uncharacterized membrane protein YccC